LKTYARMSDLLSRSSSRIAFPDIVLYTLRQNYFVQCFQTLSAFHAKENFTTNWVNAQNVYMDLS
jgi:hypothetical protein